MSIIIRPADLENDALAIMDGARDFASRVSFQHLLPKDDAAFVDVVSRIVSLEGMEILVAEHDGGIVGGIGLLYMPSLWNPAILVADEIFFWSNRDAPFRTAYKLFDEAMRRIEERKAVPMFRTLITSPPGVEKLYRRRNMHPTETLFTWLPPPLSH